MSRMTRLFGILVLGLTLMAVPCFAEESVTPAAPTGDSDPASAPAAPADQDPAALIAPPEESPEGIEAVPAVPAPVAPPALKPITITFSGEVASVAASETPPMITIQDRYGVKKEISVPEDAKITAGTASKALADLKAGDKVTVEYTYDVATGKRTAQTIGVGEAAAAAPASS